MNKKTLSDTFKFRKISHEVEAENFIKKDTYGSIFSSLRWSGAGGVAFAWPFWSLLFVIDALLRLILVLTGIKPALPGEALSISFLGAFVMISY